jgi:hypothetical protein
VISRAPRTIGPVPLAASQSAALFFLFIVLPFFVGAAVLWFVSWRWRGATPPVRTSEVLATGDAADGEVLSVKPLGGFFDLRPMVRLGVRVTPPDGGSFDLEVTQSIPRVLLKGLRTGDRVEVRVTPDRTVAAVVLGPPPDL